jgi:enolase-phosphatase E1
VTIRLASRGVDLILLDIEGTTTPIAFVQEVLFPYARTRLASWLRVHAASSEGREVIEGLRREHAAERGPDLPPPWPADQAAAVDRAVAQALWLMDRDQKSPALKQVQGLIWEEGYQAGVLRGQCFSDVAPALARWKAAGLEVAIYSSGSELAQRRLFESAGHGECLPLIAAFFDTAVGPKTDAASYRRIAAARGRAPAAVLFVSDVVRELRAAAAAGCQVALCVRPGNPPQPDAERFEAVTSFDEIL